MPIKEIGTEASRTTQTYPVTLSLHNVPIELSLLAGMSGKAMLRQSTANLSHTFSRTQIRRFYRKWHQHLCVGSRSQNKYSPQKSSEH